MSGRERYFPVEEARASTVHGVRGLWGASEPPVEWERLPPRVSMCYRACASHGATRAAGGGAPVTARGEGYKFAYRVEGTAAGEARAGGGCRVTSDRFTVTTTVTKRVRAFQKFTRLST